VRAEGVHEGPDLEAEAREAGRSASALPLRELPDVVYAPVHAGLEGGGGHEESRLGEYLEKDEGLEGYRLAAHIGAKDDRCPLGQARVERLVAEAQALAAPLAGEIAPPLEPEGGAGAFSPGTAASTRRGRES